MIKKYIEVRLKNALAQALSELNHFDLLEDAFSLLKLERPRSKAHGDYAVNVSPLSKLLKLPPPKIAENLAQAFLSVSSQNGLQTIEAAVIGGFINFKLPEDLLSQSLIAILHAETPGANQQLSGQKILLEYVSANPTGPLHIGHGRWAALGDSIRRIIEHCGGHVDAEFYINDAGVQIRRIAFSLAYRIAECLNTGVVFPLKPEGDAPYEYYPGEYVVDLAKRFLADASQPEYQEILRHISEWDGRTDQLSRDMLCGLEHYARMQLLQEQKDLLVRIGVHFDRWYSEAEELHRKGLVEQAVEKLKRNGWTYESEGALWFRSTAFGDEKDRVLVKSNGDYTYLTADIAYHEDKFLRMGSNGEPLYNRIINIWGADHHGYIARMRGAVQALGHNPDAFEVLLGQLVNLIIEGEKTRMGKRRKMLTLQDVVDEVGVDAMRFWMVSKTADTTLDFDVDLAASATEENPVFYVQYAHARCAGILRNATQEMPDTQAGLMLPPIVSPEALDAFVRGLSTQLPVFDGVHDERAAETLRNLILRLDSLEDILLDAAQNRAPHLLARYALDLASDFHSFYTVCRILLPADPQTTRNRLMLILALKKSLAQTLSLLGVSAPDKM